MSSFSPHEHFKKYSCNRPFWFFLDLKADIPSIPTRVTEKVCFVLLQQQLDGHDQPIGYWSRSLNAAESAYDTTPRERLAVVWAVLLLLPYLKGSRFTI